MKFYRLLSTSLVFVTIMSVATLANSGDSIITVLSKPIAANFTKVASYTGDTLYGLDVIPKISGDPVGSAYSRYVVHAWNTISGESLPDKTFLLYNSFGTFKSFFVDTKLYLIYASDTVTVTVLEMSNHTIAGSASLLNRVDFLDGFALSPDAKSVLIATGQLAPKFTVLSLPELRVLRSDLQMPLQSNDSLKFDYTFNRWTWNSSNIIFDIKKNDGKGGTFYTDAFKEVYNVRDSTYLSTENLVPKNMAVTYGNYFWMNRSDTVFQKSFSDTTRLNSFVPFAGATGHQAIDNSWYAIHFDAAKKNFSVWDMEKFGETLKFSRDLGCAYAFSQDASLIAFLTTDSILVFKTADGSPVSSMKCVFAANTLSPFRFVAGSGNSCVSVIDNISRSHCINIVRKVDIGTTALSLAAASGNARVFFFGSNSVGKYRFDDGLVENLVPKGTLVSTVNQIDFSPGGNQVLLNTADRIQVFNTSDGSFVAERLKAPGTTSALWSPDSTLIYLVYFKSGTTTDHIEVYNSQTLNPVDTFTLAAKNTFYGFTKSGRYFLAKEGDSTITMRFVKTGQVYFSYRNDDRIICADVNFNDWIMVLSSAGQETKTIDVPSKTVVKTVPALYNPNNIIISNTNLYNAFSFQFMTIIDGQSQHDTLRQFNCPTLPFFSANDSLLISVCSDQFYEYEIKRKIKNSFPIFPVMFSPNTGYFAQFSNDTARIYTYTNKSVCTSVSPFKKNTFGCWSKESKQVAVVDASNNVLIWKPTLPKFVDTVAVSVPSENRRDDDMIITPLPSTGTFSVTINSPELLQRVWLIDALGRIVEQATMFANKFQMGNEHLVNGTYTIHAQFSNGVVVRKSVLILR